MKQITLNKVKNNEELCLDIKTKLENEYLNSFMSIFEFSIKYDICDSAIKYVLKKYNLIKDLKKYNPSKNPETIKKIKDTKLERYGDSSYNNMGKNKQTRFEKYSGRYFSNQGYQNLHIPMSTETKNKLKQTMLTKYGVDNIFKDKTYIQTCFKNKYGDKYVNPGQVPEIKYKVQKTCLEKYGVKSPFQAKQVKDKIKATNIIRYGFSNPNKNSTILEKSRQTRFKNGTQVLNGTELEEFISTWRLDRLPTVSDYKIWLEQKVNKTYDLSNVYKMIPPDKTDLFNKKISFLESVVEDFLKENNLAYSKHDRQVIKPFELDFFLPDYNVGIEVNDIWSHNSSKGIFGHEPKKLSYHFDKTNLCLEKEIRLIHIYEPQLYDEHKWRVIRDIILHACGKSTKIYARNTYIVIDKAIHFKEFFEENNINGYRKADTAFMLFDKKSHEPVMGYCVGDAYYGKGKYDAEIARGACKLGISVIGGASKLWKKIIEYYSNKDLKGNPGCISSIVYYVDRNYYDGKSMKFLSNIETVKTQVGFWNYDVQEGKLLNRDPKNNKKIKLLEQEGKILVVGNAGTQINVWKRPPL